MKDFNITKEMVQQVMEAVESELKDDTHSEQWANFTAQLIEHPEKLATAYGITDEQLDQSYQEANRLFKNGHFKNALKLYQWLSQVNTDTPSYLFGMAACMHMLKKYDPAISLYLLAAEKDQTNPAPYYHICDCYLNIEEGEIMAAVMAQTAENIAGDQPEYQMIKERCQLLKKQLIEQLKNTGAEKLKQLNEAVAQIKTR